MSHLQKVAWRISILSVVANPTLKFHYTSCTMPTVYSPYTLVLFYFPVFCSRAKDCKCKAVDTEFPHSNDIIIRHKLPYKNEERGID